MTTTPHGPGEDSADEPQVNEPAPPEADESDPDGLPEPDPEDQGTGS